MKPREYWVLTWDTDLQRFTPQVGVPAGPYSLFGLRTALRLLRQVGYSWFSEPSVLVTDYRPPDAGIPA